MVAEKKSVWPLGGQVLEDAADVGEEAHVEHAVGLVEHEDLEACRASRTGSGSDRAGGPGVATMTSTPLRKACSCGPMPTPPKTAAPVIGVWTGAHLARCSSICAASSRVGVRISARVTPRACRMSRCRIGSSEGRRLAAARHGAGEHVAAFHGGRNRVLLDRGGTSEAHLLDAAEEIGV